MIFFTLASKIFLMDVYKGTFKIRADKEALKIGYENLSPKEKEQLDCEITFDSNKFDLYKININPKFDHPKDYFLNESPNLSDFLTSSADIDNDNLFKWIKKNSLLNLLKLPRKKKKQSIRMVDFIKIKVYSPKKNITFCGSIPSNLRKEGENWFNGTQLEAQANAGLASIKAKTNFSIGKKTNIYIARYPSNHKITWYFNKPWVQAGLGYNLSFVCLVPKTSKIEDRYIKLSANVFAAKGKREIRRSGFSKKKIRLV